MSDDNLPERGSDPLSGLAQRLAAVDAEAYLEFARMFGPKFRRYFMRHGLPEFEAVDLAGSCVTDIALKADRFRPALGRFGGWVFSIARNKMLDLLKARRRESEAVAEMPSDVTLDEPFVDEQIVLEVEAALAALSAADRTLVERRVMEGMDTYEAVSAELGVAAGTLRVRYLRAKLVLEERLVSSPAVRTKLRCTSGVARENV